MFFAILYSVSFMCSFHVKVWSNETPRNLIDSFLCISWLLIIGFGRRRGISPFLVGLWKNEYFVFSTFKDSLFAVNQSLMFATVLGGVFATGWRDPVKLDGARKVWYLLLRVFWLLLPEFSFRKRDWVLGYVSTQIWDFLISLDPKS